MTYCPYCAKQFDNWLSVRKHTSKCTKNNYSYIITLEYGPISYNEIESINYREFKNRYPNIPATTTTSIGKALRKRGILSWKAMNKEEIKQSFIRFFLENGKSPTSRDCYYTYYLPTDYRCKELFGTYNNAVVYSGLEPNKQSGYGLITTALDNNKYRSNLEAIFVNKYLLNKFTYEYEKPYPNWFRVSDFYLPEKDLYIEVAGGLRPEVIKEKIKFCVDNNLNLLVVYPNDILKDKVNL